MHVLFAGIAGWVVSQRRFGLWSGLVLGLAIGATFGLTLWGMVGAAEGVLLSGVLALFVLTGVTWAGRLGLSASENAYEVEIVDSLSPVLATQRSGSILIAAAVGCGAALIAAVMFRWLHVPSYWFSSPCIGLGFAMAAIAFGGMEWRARIQTRKSPNQGVRRSVAIAVAMGLAIMLTMSFTVAIAMVGLGVSASVTTGLLVGTFFGLGGFLRYGGFTLIKHGSLRILLYLSGNMPIRYVAFLDYATSLTFLQSVGGAFRFSHAVIMDHFAAMRPEYEYIERLLQEG